MKQVLINVLKVANPLLATLVFAHLIQGLFMFSESYFSGDLGLGGLTLGLVVVIGVCAHRFYKINKWHTELQTM